MYFLLTAPHPDDDIIGLGDYISTLIQENHEVGVWFMTDGNNKERRVEATKALNVLNVENIYWSTLPFYKSKERIWTGKDVNMCTNMLNMISPFNLAICYDADPHSTHIKCFEILKQSLINTSFKNLKNIYLYRSAWGQTTFYNMANHRLIEKHVTQKALKLRSLKHHTSQMMLDVSDGFGNNLIDRGNLDKEYYYKIHISEINTISPCFPILHRRFVKTNDICMYVYEHFVSKMKEGSRVIFPTGNTPLKLYQYCREKETNCFEIYQMDEYFRSVEYRNYLKKELTKKHQFHFIDAFALDIEAECERHEKDCHAVDLCILGIGQNGHIGFNEPFSSIDSYTRQTDLSKNTQLVNGTSSTKAITIGLKTILSSKEIVLMANKNKKNIIEKLLKCTSFNNEIPASCLGLHRNVHIIYEDAKLISNANYG